MLTSWVKKCGLAFGAAVIAIPGAAMAGIVVGSSGPSASQYPLGKQLGDNSTISLRDGDSVTVMVNGSTRVLKGPGPVKVATIGGASKVKTFDALVKPRGAARVRPGAVRNADSAGAKISSPNLWYLTTSQEGAFCIVDPAAIRLWRPNSDAAASYRIASSANAAASSTAEFAKGSILTAWDSVKLPVTDGSRFTIEMAGSPKASVTFAILAQQPQTPEATATALIEKGCNSQLALLSDALAVNDRQTGW